MKKLLLTFFFISCFFSPSFADEVFANINFGNANEIHRIDTDDEPNYSIGWAFSTEHQNVAYFIDPIKNHRFIYKDNNSFIEEFWRGDSLFPAFSREIGIFPYNKDENNNGYNASFFILPGYYNKESKTGFYRWKDSNKGDFYINGKYVDIEPIYESKEKEKRFACFGTEITGDRKYYVIGTDILKQWLNKFNLPTDKAICSEVTSISMENALKSMIYIYSEPEDSIYRFVINEENEIEVGLPKIIKVDFKVETMTLAENGNLYLASKVPVKAAPTNLYDSDLMMETNSLLNPDSEILENTPNLNEDISEEELIEREKKFNFLTKDVSCELILSRAYFQYYYELPFGNEKIKKLDYELSLGKEYYSCILNLKKIKLRLLNESFDVLIEESKKPGNTVGELKDKVPGFDNTFRRPQSSCLAVVNYK